MTKTEKDLLVTNIVNVLLFVIIFVFGYLRWQKLQAVIVESTDSQTEYKAIHKAVKFTRVATFGLPKIPEPTGCD